MGELQLLLSFCSTELIEHLQWHEAVQGGFLAQQHTEVLLHLVGLKKDVRDKCTDPRHRVACPFDSDDFVPFPSCCVIPSDVCCVNSMGVFIWLTARIGCLAC